MICQFNRLHPLGGQQPFPLPALGQQHLALRDLGALPQVLARRDGFKVVELGSQLWNDGARQNVIERNPIAGVQPSRDRRASPVFEFRQSLGREATELIELLAVREFDQSSS